jgi:hypothetical protein
MGLLACASRGAGFAPDPVLDFPHYWLELACGAPPRIRVEDRQRAAKPTEKKSSDDMAETRRDCTKNPSKFAALAPLILLAFFKHNRCIRKQLVLIHNL